jgi:hypothetical protein
MLGMNVFTQDAFSALTLTSTIERVPFLPTLLGDMNIFTPNPIRTTALAVEERDGVLTLLPTSQRGQPINTERTTEKRKVRYFETPRIVHGDTITAAELQNIRAFGEETEFMQLQAEVARRLAGPTGLLSNLAYTMENMRLGAVQGLLVDADGSTIYNWYDEFGIAAPAEVAFNLAAGSLNTLRPLCNQVTRAMARASKGALLATSKIVGLCGDEFYDLFVNHPDVIRTFVNWSEARDIRDGDAGAAFRAFEFGGIRWVNYRGSDDNATIKIPDDKVKFFPSEAPGVFEVAYSPAETFDFVNTPGKEAYVIPVFDRDRNMWWRQEVYSYPLPICKRPEVLRSGTAGAGE